MNPASVVLVVTTYNSQSYVTSCIRGCLAQTHRRLRVIVADDGSTDGTLSCLRAFASEDLRLTILALGHGERGQARAAALAAAEGQFDYLLFLDDDMVPTPDLVETCLLRSQATGAQALVVPEIPWSSAQNYWTRVKVFERRILNAAGSTIDRHSIEAARFWSQESWKASGGLNPHQIAFEEIQPTLRWRDQGGLVVRVLGAGLYHNEKRVTFAGLTKKKAYYFEAMGTTIQMEEHGFLKALERWYFFRPTLYRRENWRNYALHPHLALGMAVMYLALTGLAALQLARQLLLVSGSPRRSS